MSRGLRLDLHSSEPDTPRLVPVRLLIRTLDALQRAVFDAGESLYGEHGPRRAGRRPGVVEESCSLEIVEIGGGSVQAELRPVEPPAELFEDADNLGDRAVEIVERALAALQEDDPQASLRRLIPSASYRQRVLADLEAACPRRGEGFVVTASDGDGLRFVFNADAKEAIERVRHEPVEDVRSLIGELVQLRLIETRSFNLRRHEREVRCAYQRELVDAVLENAGQMVAVRGRVSLDENDRIQRMDQVFDIEPVELTPLMLGTLAWRGRSLRFVEPQRIRPAVADDVVVMELPALGIVAYGETSEEALESFYEEVFWIWDEYVQADDDGLSRDALELKRDARALLRENDARARAG